MLPILLPGWQTLIGLVHDHHERPAANAVGPPSPSPPAALSPPVSRPIAAHQVNSVIAASTIPRMEDKTAVTFEELRAFAALALDQAEAELGSQIVLGADLFWDIEPGSAFDLIADPEVNVASIAECLGDLRAELAEPTPAAWHTLNHFGGLIRALTRLTLP